MKLQVQNKRKKKMYAKIVVFSSVILAVVLVRPTWNIWQKYQQSKREVRLAEKEFQELKERIAYLEAEQEKLKTQSGLEEEVVKKFDVVREGEELAVIVEEEPEEIEEKEEKSSVSKFFEKYFGWLFGKENQ